MNKWIKQIQNAEANCFDNKKPFYLLLLLDLILTQKYIVNMNARYWIPISNQNLILQIVVNF